MHSKSEDDDEGIFVEQGRRVVGVYCEDFYWRDWQSKLTYPLPRPRSTVSAHVMSPVTSSLDVSPL